MNVKYLAIEQDDEVHDRESKFLLSHNVGSIRVTSMSEGIEKAAANEFLYIVINASNIEYASKLEMLRETTPAPILLATALYSRKEHARATELGADLFGEISEKPAENHRAVMATIDRLNARAAQPEISVNPIIYGNIIIMPAQRRTFVDYVEVELTRTDMAILRYLISRRGNVLTFEQIYRHVWRGVYDESACETVKSAVKRLRRKIDAQHADSSLIKNVWGVGYKLP